MKILFALLVCGALVCFNANAGDNVYDIRFGVIQNTIGYDDIAHETNVIELIPKSKGYYFGFRIIPKGKSTYSYYTVSYLPAAPKVLEGVLNKEPLANYSSGFKSPETSATGAIIIPGWFDEGDPIGVYKTDLYIDGVKQKSVEFKVIASLKKNQ